jgi:hypothetical protein
LPCDVYLGPRELYDGLAAAVRAGLSNTAVREAIAQHIWEHSHLFAADEDGDTVRWIERFACYSPIIHLQQTDGTVSAHKCFTSELNAWGRIRAEDVLKAILKSSLQDPLPGFPPRVETIWLTLEPFFPTASHPRLMLEQIAESVAYWRRYVPRDGMEIGAL